MVASFDKKRKRSNPGNKNVQGSLAHKNAGGGPMPIVDTPTSTTGVSNCYVFKSRLQEYAQKVGLPTPVYETIKEGPSHEPYFKSTVIINGVRYDSLPGFFNRKAAEQSAAEVALVELSKCGEKKESISVPVHETGLCKNLLQEYAQKMNYAIPTYTCQKDDAPGRTPLFSCIVDIGGIQYIGATAKTKKEAEIKAARTALLAIRSSTNAAGEDFGGEHEYTVVPSKRKASETVPPKVDTVKRKKPKKPRLNKKQRRPGNGGEKKAENTSISANDDMGCQVAVEQLPVNIDMGSQVAVEKLPVNNDMASQVAVEQLQNGQSALASSAQDNGSLIISAPTGDGGLVLQVSSDCQEEPTPIHVDAKPIAEENCSGVSEVQLHEAE